VLHARRRIGIEISNPLPATHEKEMTEVTFDSALHEYRDAKGSIVPSVTQILARDGICDFSFVEEEVRNRAMERGTSVHWLLQLEDEGALNYRQVPPGLRSYRKAYLDWKKAAGFIPQLIEYKFISHYGYAGTVDRFGCLANGTWAVVDFKTGEIPDWVRYQLSAYAMRMHVVPAVARTIRRIALALRKDGTYSVREFPRETWDLDWAKFYDAKRRVDAGHVDHNRTRD
jgi:hypothetical protein